VIRPLGSTDAAAFREIRLEALRLCPEAFSSSFEEEQLLTAAEFARRVAPELPDVVFGSFLDNGTLVGIAGFQVHKKAKERYKSTLWGMYVRPSARGSGVGTAMLRSVIEHARGVPGLECILLTVTANNAAARALYDRVGFVPYGIEPRALRLAPADYRDEELRRLDLTLL
jgi:RimJ/RimL family protein N-acetyltransferase